MSVEFIEVTPQMQKVVTLVQERIDIYCHQSTNTHIVCQKPETVFTSFPLKGVGDSEEEALDQIEHKLVEALAGKSGDEIDEIAKQCEKIEPSIDRPSEVS